MLRLVLWPSTLVVLLGCSSSTGRPVKLGDGGYELSCKGPLVGCLKHAERLCRNQGYTVESAHDTRERLGHESGQSQVVIEKSDARIYCGSRESERPSIKLERAEAAPAAATEASTALPSARACVPGATQACVGPGGCSGGQACSADGTRFEQCVCAPAAPPPTAPALTP